MRRVSASLLTGPSQTCASWLQRPHGPARGRAPLRRDTPITPPPGLRSTEHGVHEAAKRTGRGTMKRPQRGHLRLEAGDDIALLVFISGEQLSRDLQFAHGVSRPEPALCKGMEGLVGVRLERPCAHSHPQVRITPPAAGDHRCSGAARTCPPHALPVYRLVWRFSAR